MTENNESGFSFEINASNPYEHRQLLGELIDMATKFYDGINQRIHEQEREAAFVRYCRTGRFE